MKSLAFLALLVLANLALLEAFSARQKESDINFWLFTRRNRANWQRHSLKLDNLRSVRYSHFDGAKETKVIIHGFLGGFDKDGFAVELKDAFLEKEDVNVILVDWGKLAKTLYHVAVKNTKFVGKTTAKMIEYLENQKGASRKRMHLIGHSLGGQTVGFVGMNLTPRPARITGLDTADIGFNPDDRDDFLDPSDADFVDEIMAIVSNKPKGHANFKPNGGRDGHSLPNQYFIASVKAGKCAYPAYTCDSWEKFSKNEKDCRSSDGNHMGYYAEKPSGGKQVTYYLKATKENPC